MVIVTTLGCKVNQYESNKIIDELNALGIHASDKSPVGLKDGIYVVNTCSVTGVAERKSRHAVSTILSRDPNAKIIVCGCATELDKTQFKGVIKAFGTEKSEIVNYIKTLVKPSSATTTKQTKSRANIKVQDGCDNFCSYCIIPHLRGRSRSRNISEIVDEIKLLPHSIKEVVLTGINLSKFEPSLIQLCEAVNQTGKTFRLSSIHPHVITQDFLTGLKTLSGFNPNFHISLQSGSDTVLKAMNRKYTTAEYKTGVDTIREHFPSAYISTDVIVGYPTETEDDFNQTLEFVNQIKFSKVHVFPFSIRTGTVAANLPPLQPSIITERAKRLSSLLSS